MTRRPKLLKARDILAAIESIDERDPRPYTTEHVVGFGLVRVSFYPIDAAKIHRAVRVSYEGRGIQTVTRYETDRLRVEYLARPPQFTTLADLLTYGPRDLITLVRSSIDWMLEPVAAPYPPEVFP